MRRKIVFLPYDFDTAIGINNEGTLEFSYNLEDIDQTEGGADVFNGQQSVLWKNIRATYFEELRTMFQTLRSTGALSYEKIERMFEEHQAKWPEAVFNEDAWFKYLAPLVEKGNASYLSMLQGSKAEQRKWWLYNRFRYMDSKYNAGDSLSDVITVRGYAKSNISITPYADVYASIKYGSYLVQERAARNVATVLVCPLDNVNDTEIYIYSASQLASVGDLSGLMVGYADFSRAVRLQSLKLGDASVSYSNGNLKELHLGNNELLRTIDVRNCPALTQAVDISGCSNIEHVFFDGTSITGLELPDGGILKTLHLPSTMAALSIVNQPSITEFVFSASSALTTLRLENVSNAVDSLSMVRAMPGNSRVRLIGFTWNLADYAAVTTLYDHLDTLRGTNESGDNLDNAQLYGTIHLPAMTTVQLREAKTRYGDISFAADEWTYRIRFYNGDTLVHTEYITEGDNAEDPVIEGTIETPEKPSVGHTGYVYSGWDGVLTNVTEDRDLHAVYTETHAYEVTFKNWDDTVLLVKLVPEGTTCSDPVRTGEIDTPTKPGDANYVYSFLGWTGASLVNVTTDRTVIARYSEVTSYTIRFLNWDGSVLLTLYLQAGAQVPDPFQAHLLETPVRPDDGSYEYTFVGWNNLNNDGTFPTVSYNRDFTAQFTYTRYYLMTFKNYDGSVLLTEKYYYNDQVTDPIANGRMPVPTKEADENYNYHFLKWTISFPRTIQSSTTATAKFYSDAMHTVTFKDWDGTILDTQEVLDGHDAVDPIPTGRIATPLRSSTAQYDYTFRGWGSSFLEVYSDKNIVAQYDAFTRSYDVHFMDETREMGRTTVLYGNTATCPVWPDKTGEDAGKYFVRSWTPPVSNIRAETSVYAVWLPLIQDSWAEIIAAEQDGTYTEKYSIGQVKLLDLGAEGKIPMRIVGFNKDERADGTGQAKISWLAMSPIESERNAGFTTADSSIQAVYYDFVQKNSAELGTYYESTNTTDKTNSSTKFTITAQEDTDVTIWAYCSSEDFWDVMNVWVNDEHVVNCIGRSAGETKEVVCHLTAGEPMIVEATYHKDTGKSGGEDRARIRFLSSVDLTITRQRGVFKPFGGIPYGWLDCTLRGWLADNILPLFPSELRNNVVTVKKYSATDNAGSYVTSEDQIWVPSRRELMNKVTSSDTNIETVGCQYDEVFNENNYTENVIAIRGTPTDGFLRTCIAASNRVYRVSSGGGPTYDTVNRPYHVYFGFCT